MPTRENVRKRQHLDSPECNTFKTCGIQHNKRDLK